MQLPPEVNLICFAHYLQALECQRDATRVVALLGGKSPHIQNLAVGGVANPINLDGIEVLNIERLDFLKSFIDRLEGFIENVYKPDAVLLACYYPDAFKTGGGVKNYISVPNFPVDEKSTEFVMEGGFIKDGDLATFRPITSYTDDWLIKGITESTKHSWYDDEGKLHPWEGQTEPNYTGWDADDKYSWVKSPAFYGEAVQLGPLANMMCMITAGNQDCQRHFDDITRIINDVSHRQYGLEDMHSTMGRVIARAVRCGMLHEVVTDQFNRLIANIKKGDTSTYNKPDMPDTEIKGVGFLEAPRGMLSHWVVIEEGKIKNYQAVVPSTWNAGPRNEDCVPGPYEQALVGLPVADLDKPLEVLRVIHSFDPCMSCAIHLFDTEGLPVNVIKVL